MKWNCGFFFSGTKALDSQLMLHGYKVPIKPCKMPINCILTHGYPYKVPYAGIGMF